jgi:acetyl esterase/lipase
MSSVLRFLEERLGGPNRVETSANAFVPYTMVCVSYRGYWTSQGRPSEKGIMLDGAAALEWIRSQQSPVLPHRPISLIFWGQSIGAGVATCLAARHEFFKDTLSLRMLILETPFTSIRDMLVALYPQKWLPYRYLWPFLRNHLDSIRALEEIAKRPQGELPEVVLVQAGNDELVPSLHGDILAERCAAVGMPVSRHVINGALHTEVLSRPEGRRVIADALARVS